MNTYGPILVLDDDPDDTEILETIFLKLETSSKRKYFLTPESFLQYLTNTPDHPLIIISDINMAKKNGIALKAQIDADEYLKAKSIPFVFLTTHASQMDVNSAFRLNSQGFFLKPLVYQDMCNLINTVLCYWRASVHPNNFEH